MQGKPKLFAIATTAFLVLSMILSLTPQASAAGAITLSTSSGAPSGTVTVTGTSFAAGQAVGIAVGAEVVVTGEVRTNFNGSGMGPWTSTLAHYPIKPGSFSMHWDTAGTGSDWTDKGDGTMTSDSAYAAGTTINYATGQFGRTSTVDLSDYALTATCTYTYYQYGVTPTAGVTANSAGTFTSTVTLPAAITNGNYVVTAVDAKGGKANASITIVPEGLTIGIVVVLSAAAVVAATYLIKKPNKTLIAPTKAI
jgi:hypothetical protein